jgi:hypothetical protein
VVEGEVLHEVLRGHEDDPGPSALALRLMGAVHRIVLRGDSPELAGQYPSAGGEPRNPWPAFLDTVRVYADALRRLVDDPVQTNEPARCAGLLGGFLEIARRAGPPLRLLEVGASAGLNLRFDSYRLRARRRALGTGRLGRCVEVAPVARAGCDAQPVDPRSQEGRLTLAAYVWADQVERLERLRAALTVAGRVDAPVERAHAAEWIEERLAQPAGGAVTVVFHSIVMQYLTAAERERFERALRGAREPLAWLRMEPEGERLASLRLTLWPAGDELLLARVGFHGDPVEWLARAV